MQIESGKYYITTGGSIRGPMRKVNGNCCWPWTDSILPMWTDCGTYDSFDHPLNIVEEYNNADS